LRVSVRIATENGREAETRDERGTNRGVLVWTLELGNRLIRYEFNDRHWLETPAKERGVSGATFFGELLWRRLGKRRLVIILPRGANVRRLLNHFTQIGNETLDPK